MASLPDKGLNDLSILLHGKKCFVLKCSNWLLGGYGLPLTVHFTKTFTPYIHCNDSSKTVRSVRKTLLKYSILITLYSNFGLIKWVINITVKTSNASSFFFSGFSSVKYTLKLDLIFSLLICQTIKKDIKKCIDHAAVNTKTNKIYAI